MADPVSVTPVTAQLARELIEEQFARERAQYEREWLHQILNAAPAMIAVLLGPTHVFEFANTRFIRMANGAQLAGRPIREALPGVGLDLLDLLDEVYATGERRRREAIATPMGHFDFIYEPLRNRAGSVEGIIMHAVDVTEQVAARSRERAHAAELARTAAALRRSNRELDAFAYAASHDLRAPLRGIANLAQWIEEDLEDKLTDEGREMLALMRSRMHRMESLIDGILQYSRAGRTHEPAADISVAAVVADVVDLLAPESATIVVNPDLPTIRAERLPLQQVFQNLISNAIKHGGAAVTIEISARDDGAFWEFRVSDDGPGIAPEFHDRIWGIFQTLQPRDHVEGAGIGLSLVKKLVEAQGGRVGVESTQGQGATFIVWWPKVAEDANA